MAYKEHMNDLFELSNEERNAFMADVILRLVRWTKFFIRQR